MISGFAELLFDNHTPADSPRFCQKLHKVVDTLQNKAGHLMAQGTDDMSFPYSSVYILGWEGTESVQRGTSTGRRNGPNKNFTTPNNRRCDILHLVGGKTPGTSIHQGWQSGKAALQRRTWTLCCPDKQKLNISQQRPSLSAGRGRWLFLSTQPWRKTAGVLHHPVWDSPVQERYGNTRASSVKEDEDD